MQRAVVNGRFTGRVPTGVDRVALELSKALMQNHSDTMGRDLSILTPNGPRHLVEVSAHQTPQWREHFWEQFQLPFINPRQTLLSLCNSGPILRRNQIVMIHDAQVCIAKESYSPVFRAWYRAMQPILARRSRSVVTVSEFSRRTLEDHKVIPKGKAVVIHNGADHILRTRPDIPQFSSFALEPRRYFLALGNLAPHKNLKMLIRAAEQRQNTHIPLVLAGGASRQDLRRAGIKESKSLRILGPVSDQLLKALYENALAFLFPSRTEGFGLPPLEAMNCGCPVIASTGGAIPEICGDAAMLLDPHQPAQWAAKMDIFEQEMSLHQKFSDLGRVRAAKFTWSTAATKLAAVVNNMQAHADAPNPVGALKL
ncbi:MAG: glycosyltransferase family 4 protein [Cognatishimia sp.]|uniref:glycosyltransferase family 4 protein n=1 Tax=Cognatishimia sp. TaxID=2211648 RepID=UPI003B8CB2E3